VLFIASTYGIDCASFDDRVDSRLLREARVDLANVFRRAYRRLEHGLQATQSRMSSEHKHARVAGAEHTVIFFASKSSQLMLRKNGWVLMASPPKRASGSRFKSCPHGKSERCGW